MIDTIIKKKDSLRSNVDSEICIIMFNTFMLILMKGGEKMIIFYIVFLVTGYIKQRDLNKLLLFSFLL